jgi:hypothetical protein
VFVGNRYLVVKTDEPMLTTGQWHHIAGVYDGKQGRLYVDGRLVAKGDRAGKRRTNALPLLVGADVTGQGTGTSFFDGLIDSVRLSKVARYEGEAFTPARSYEADGDTLLLLEMDQPAGRWIYDWSAAAAHSMLRGEPRVVAED